MTTYTATITVEIEAQDEESAARIAWLVAEDATDLDVASDARVVRID